MRKLDYRYLLLILLIIVIIICVLTQHQHSIYEASRTSYDVYDVTMPGFQDQLSYDNNKTIIVNGFLFDKFVDKILQSAYSAEQNKAFDDLTTEQRTTLYVYMMTFQLFNINFHHKRLEHLDQSLNGVYLVRTDVPYPSWSKYPNLQIAIANLVGKELTATEHSFIGDPIEDRKMVAIYLSTLMDLVGVKRV